MATDLQQTLIWSSMLASKNQYTNPPLWIKYAGLMIFGRGLFVLGLCSECFWGLSKFNTHIYNYKQTVRQHMRNSAIQVQDEWYYDGKGGLKVNNLPTEAVKVQYCVDRNLPKPLESTCVAGFPSLAEFLHRCASVSTVPQQWGRNQRWHRFPRANCST